MKDFAFFLDSIGEIGYVEETLESLVYSNGLPKVRPGEIVLFETGEKGLVMSMTADRVEILLLSKGKIKIATKVARTNELLKIPVADHFLGKTLNPLGEPIDGSQNATSQQAEFRPVDITPPGLLKREAVSEPLETGVTWVDLLIPLGRGQRELVIGDRRTGKDSFLLQAVLSQARQGTVCIYAAIGKRLLDIVRISEFVKRQRVESSVIIVSSSSSDPAGFIFLTPYTAMTLAEYFKDKGRNVLIVLDDLTTHAKFYRQISLLANRFPGRSSYPGDIFYVHSRLLERAGKFSQGASISCLSVAETVLGDLSGYIQTNLMAMTDGHIFFDTELANLGRRPAINPYLSVTRVGYQTQSTLLQDLSRQVRSFLVEYNRMREFVHFGAELSEGIKRTISLGEKALYFFDQSPEVVVPVNVNIYLLASLWAGFWNEVGKVAMKKEMQAVIDAYQKDAKVKAEIDTIVLAPNTFSGLIKKAKESFKTLAALTQRAPSQKVQPEEGKK